MAAGEVVGELGELIGDAAKSAKRRLGPAGALQCDGAFDGGMDGAATAGGLCARHAPRYLIRDRDQVYGARFCRQALTLDIREVVIAPRSPWQSAYAERVIGSIRRECLDHVVVMGEGHLLRILSTYLVYYNEMRTHVSLGKDAPERRSVQPAGQARVVEVPRVGGLDE
jgi:transposase InsO family protein